ncbi:MAG: hypothetical protein R3263_10010, partial [Myxococcota bacterium]|nr:hypothetical protein [Myxococcota bacterium]
MRTVPGSALGLALALAVTLPAPPVRTQEPAARPAAPTQRLPAALRTAFLAEMRHLESQLQALASGVARGDWDAVEASADRIRSAFILERDLDAAQRRTLRETLPDDFVALDRRFHERAERVAEAARARDAELAGFYTWQLLDACTGCHARYARHRFPGLVPEAEAAPGHA